MMKNYKKTFLICIVLFVIFSISIGYSAFSSELSISKIVADVRVKQDIRITDISVSSSSSINGNYGVPKIEYDADSIILTQVFASYDDFIEVSVNITNFGNTNMGIFNISVPQGIGYKLTDYELKDKLCNDIGKCNLGASKIIKLKMYPTSDEGFNLENSIVDFDFREMHSITYSGVTNNGYTTEIIDGGNLSIQFTSDTPENVVVYSDGKVNSSKYTYSNGTLTMNNVSGDLVIKSVKNLYNMIKLKTNGIDTNINFKVASSETNGDGVNTLSGTENNQYPVYYYRGAVEDNNVKFANFCWKMVRTTETGGVKLIYNGTVADDGSCNNTGTASAIGTSKFNEDDKSPSNAGYMYGATYSVLTRNLITQSEPYIYGNDVEWDGTNYTLIGDAMTSISWAEDYETLATKYHYTCFNDTGICETVYYLHDFRNSNNAYYLTLKDGKNIENAKEEMFANRTDSKIKTTIDNWYKAKMNLYTNYLEDTVWCNDRTFHSSGPLYDKDTSGAGGTIFIAYNRNYNTFKPSITCSNTRDSFTVNSTNGNGKLFYPVGLLTADEMTLAGSGSRGYNTSNYLYIGYDYWSLSPCSFNGDIVRFHYLSENGYLGHLGIHYDFLVRPSVSLKPGTYVSTGDGSVSNPYIVE
ncbi:MAG: hypothetical protein IJA30_02290 [Bacilli bacterium]|nr:hypothetical protein [Bacilli bacterium]